VFNSGTLRCLTLITIIINMDSLVLHGFVFEPLRKNEKNMFSGTTRISF
jgi:hypothetical protein